MVELLEGQLPEKTGGRDLRGFEWYYLWRLCHSERVNLKGHTDAVQGVAFSPDGQRLASGSDDNTIILWDVSNPSSPSQLGPPLLGHTVKFSPDGKLLISASANLQVILW